MLIEAFRQLFRGQPVDMAGVIAQIISVLFIVIFILPLHEYAHGWTAKKLGDPTAQLEGRLTFNPLASVDPMGALWLLLFGFGWAKPVPVNPRYFKNPKRDMAIVAVAGPLSNFLAALVGAFIYVAILCFAPLNNSIILFIARFLVSYVVVNISIAVFNLLPVPPLDGSRIIAAFLSDRATQAYYRNQNIISMIFFILILAGAFSGPLGFAQNALLRVVLTIAKAPFQLFGLTVPI